VSHRCWKLSPADFAFLWDECPRCFYLKVVLGFPRPRPLVPKVVSRIDERMKAGCEGRRTETLASDMPAGVFEFGERWVESQPIDVHLPDAVHRCLLQGTLDTVVRLDDGGYAVVGFQMGERRAEQVPVDTRQLHAYAYALEHPARGAVGLAPITRLGLLVFEPETFAREAAGLGALTGGLSWVEIPRDDGLLFGFLAEVLSVLERPEPPGGAPLCGWCVYRDASRRTGL
jgi:hypothetical protein